MLVVIVIWQVLFGCLFPFADRTVPLIVVSRPVTGMKILERRN